MYVTYGYSETIPKQFSQNSFPQIFNIHINEKTFNLPEYLTTFYSDDNLASLARYWPNNIYFLSYVAYS